MPYNLGKFFKCTCYVWKNEQFNYETCHPVYPEIGLKIGFLSHKTLRLRGVAESEASEINHAPSVYSVQHYFQALKRVTFYDGF